jgi:membrane associated rhomboid family serine protease
MFLPIGSNIPRMRFPWFTISWIVASIGLYFGVTHSELNLPFEQTRTYHWAVVPASSNEVWKFLTYQFMHSSLSHLIANIWYLAIFGWILESAIGGIPFLVVSLVGGGIAVLPERFFQAHPELPVIGASGSVAVMMGAVFALFPWSRVRLLLAAIPIKNFPMSFFMPIRYLILFWLALQISGLAASLWVEPTAVAYSTHLMGLAVGLVVGLGLKGFVRYDFFDIELMGADLKRFYEALKEIREGKEAQAAHELIAISESSNLRPQVQRALFTLSLQYKMKEVSDTTWKRLLTDWLWFKDAKGLVSSLRDYFEAFKVLPPMDFQQRIKVTTILSHVGESEILSKLRAQSLHESNQSLNPSTTGSNDSKLT